MAGLYQSSATSSLFGIIKAGKQLVFCLGTCVQDVVSLILSAVITKSLKDLIIEKV